MPPKKNQPSNKTIEKNKQKIIENKKGKKQQEYVKSVQQSVKGQTSHRDKKEIEQAKKEEAEMKNLFKVVIDKPKIDESVDPKTILCSYFKHGLCKKGDRCIYSHDMNIIKNSEKKNMYHDIRDVDKNETCANWDQETLEKVIDSKRAAGGGKNKTDIVCKHFLDAVERGTYGWFWTCPNNGDSCHYRHALPPGYVLKRDRMQADKENEDKGPTIEEIVEEERYNLMEALTPINDKTFGEWKAKRIRLKKQKLKEELVKKKEEYMLGNKSGRLTGRELFTFDPNMAENDDDEWKEGNDEVYVKDLEEGEENVAVKEINFDVDDEVKMDSFEKAVPDEKATFANSLNPKQREALLFKDTLDDDNDGKQGGKKNEEVDEDELIEHMENMMI